MCQIVSAVQGIAIAKPSVSENVVPISIAFLVVLFLVQRFGTHAIGRAFGPVMLVWFLVIGAMGVVNIIAFPGIWRACDPSRAIMCESSQSSIEQSRLTALPP